MSIGSDFTAQTTQPVLTDTLSVPESQSGLPVEKRLPEPPGVSEVVDTGLTQRNITRSQSLPAPVLEKPRTSSLKAVLQWFKSLFTRSSSKAAQFPMTEAQLYKLLPEACSQLVSQTQSDIQRSFSCPDCISNSHRPFETVSELSFQGTEKEPVAEELEEDEFFDALEYQPEEVRPEEGALADKAKSEKPSFNEKLNNKAWAGVCKAGRALSPVGRVLRRGGRKLISEEKMVAIEGSLKDVLKSQVQYEVTQNKSRRAAQILLGLGIGSLSLPWFLSAWRVNDFKNELMEIYRNRNIKPLLIDLTMTYGPMIAMAIIRTLYVQAEEACG